MNERRQELDERIADDERHSATMRKARDYDDLLARAEAAEALAYERLESAVFAEQRANDAEVERDELRDANSVLSDALETTRQTLVTLTARAAELEAQLAAQGWRPVTENPVVTMQYQVVVQHSRQQPTADHMAYYPSSGWTGTDVIYWRPIPPLPAPDANEEPTS